MERALFEKSIFDDVNDLNTESICKLISNELDSALKKKNEKSILYTDVDVVEWVTKNLFWLNKPFSFIYSPSPNLASRMARPYLLTYYKDYCIRKVVQKCRQSEITHTEMNKGLWFLANTEYTSLIHLFPTSGQGKLFSKQKLSPATNQSYFLNNIIQKPESKMQKTYGTSHYIIESSWSDFGGRGPSCDYIIYDEYQTQNPEIEDIFGESLSHSQYGIKNYISTPMSPGTGINKKYNETNQMIWIVKCKKCNKEQELKFPDNIMGFFEKGEKGDYGKAYIGCIKCGTKIERNEKYYWINSRWVPQNPKFNKAFHGYKITGIMLPWNTAGILLQKYHDMKFVYQFYNEVLGIDFVSSEDTLTIKDFQAIEERNFINQFRTTTEFGRTAIGVDWGPNESYIEVSAKKKEEGKFIRRIVYVEKIVSKEPEKRVLEITKALNGRIIIADSNDTSKNMYLLKNTRGTNVRFYACQYSTESRKSMKVGNYQQIPRWDDKQFLVRVPRTAYLKYIIREIIDKEVRIPSISPDIQRLCDHILNLVLEKKVIEDDLEIEFMSHKGPDHLAHANLYSRVGFEKLFMKTNSAGIYYFVHTNEEGKETQEKEHNALGIPVQIIGNESTKEHVKKGKVIMSVYPDTSGDIGIINRQLQKNHLKEAYRKQEVKK